MQRLMKAIPAVRAAMFEAFEQKYGEPPARVVASFLLAAEPEEIVQRFQNNPGPGTQAPTAEQTETKADPQTDGQPTADVGPVVPELPAAVSGDPEFGEERTTLVQRMVPVYRQAFKDQWGKLPSEAELERVMAVGLSESNFGTARYPGLTQAESAQYHNHGAVQCGKPPCGPDCFESWDTHPVGATGANEKYVICFKRYPDDVAGAKNLIKLVGRSPHRMSQEDGNSVLAFSLGMYGNHYYEMFNPSAAVRAAHATDIRHIQKLAKRRREWENEWFNSGTLRATDSVHAGRVLMHAIGINRAIESIAKARGVRRQTSFGSSGTTLLDLPTVSLASTGGMIGFYTGGPPGAALGAALGAVAGKIVKRFT